MVHGFYSNHYGQCRIREPIMDIQFCVTAMGTRANTEFELVSNGGGSNQATKPPLAPIRGAPRCVKKPDGGNAQRFGAEFLHVESVEFRMLIQWIVGFWSSACCDIFAGSPLMRLTIIKVAKVACPSQNGWCIVFLTHGFKNLWDDLVLNTNPQSQ